MAGMSPDSGSALLLKNNLTRFTPGTLVVSFHLSWFLQSQNKWD